MTGNFTERGDVAVIDKWKRTEIALKLGIDLVIELPFPFATQSADTFAYGSLTILEQLQVERVIFGSESDKIDDLTEIAKVQIKNEELEKLVKIYSRLGNNYPTALSNAIYDLTGKKIKTPNDLLGISYIKTILKEGYHIIPEVIKREDNYHEKELSSSASAIRNALKNKMPVDSKVPQLEQTYLTTLHFIEDYFPLLKYKITTEKDLSIYQDVEEGIEHKLKKEISSAKSLEDFLEKIKTKRYTQNKITRMLIHILCNFTKEQRKRMDKITYLRILGLSQLGKKYLNQIKKELKIPLISKITRDKDEMLELEIETTKIYEIPHTENLTKKEFQKIIEIGEKEND